MNHWAIDRSILYSYFMPVRPRAIVHQVVHGKFDYTTNRHEITVYYTMAWLPAFQLKTHRHLSTWATTMRVPFVYERRRYATMVKIRHGLATLYSNNSVVYGQKHKVWVLVFLVRTSGTFLDQIEQIW